ncbi:MAG: serine/threonine-protein kinase [Myxococcota bacterium]
MGDSEFVETCELFGKYELLEKIATGGMAEIFRAVSSSIGGFRKIVAVKRILPHLSNDAEFVSLFIAEAKLAVSLNHGNIVQIFDFGRVDTSHYIAMEFIEGRDLTQILIKQSRRRKLVPIEVGCFVLAQMLRGLEYAHTRRAPNGDLLGVVHRDVSPHNVLVSYDGEVKITDFGIAKARNHVTLTKPGIILGKFAYMSPEQARGEAVDARTDVYASGITLYEALTGRRLFYSDDPAQTLAKVRNPRIPLPSKYNPAIPAELDTIVLRALSPRLDERFQTARELATALSSFLARTAPDFTDFELAHFMKELFGDEVDASKFTIASAAPKSPSYGKSAATARASAASSATGSTEDPIVAAQLERLLSEPNLWVVAELGDRLLRLGRPEEAVRALRVAALKFAQNGLLVQSIALYVQLLEITSGDPNITREIAALPGLAGKKSKILAELVGSVGRDRVGRVLTDVVSASEPSPMAGAMATPLFSFLNGEELMRFARLLKLRRVAPGVAIVEEGQQGQSMYIVARGRVLIYCKNFQGERVYLTSLSDGDCFGEFSFFTGEPRAATVEALEEVWVFEISQGDFDKVIDEFPSLTRALLQFYKERVVATLLAKSEVFGVLPPRVRASLVERLKLETFQKNEVIIREQDASDGFYLVKGGEVEVYSDRRGYVLLSKLHHGDFFGEIAAVTKQPRTASVRALCTTEVLRLSSADLQELGAANPEMMRILEKRIKQREAETAQRITAGGFLI